MPAHWPAWVAFNKRIGSSGEVGIWHETYLISAGSYECVYNNMPPLGLGAATRLIPAAGRKATAASRAGDSRGGVSRWGPLPRASRSEGFWRIAGHRPPCAVGSRRVTIEIRRRLPVAVALVACFALGALLPAALGKTEPAPTAIRSALAQTDRVPGGARADAGPEPCHRPARCPAGAAPSPGHAGRPGRVGGPQLHRPARLGRGPPRRVGPPAAGRTHDRSRSDGKHPGRGVARRAALGHPPGGQPRLAAHRHLPGDPAREGRATVDSGHAT